MIDFDILIGDDNPNQLERSKSILRGINWKGDILNAVNEKDFFKSLESNNPRFVVLNPLLVDNKSELVQKLTKFPNKDGILFFGAFNDVKSFFNGLAWEVKEERCIEKPDSVIEFSVKLSDTLKELGIIEEKDFEKKNYYELDWDYLKKVSKSPCDLFLNIGKEKFIKFCHSNDSVDFSVIEKYQAKGLKTFFLRREDFEAHSSAFFTDELISKKLVADDSEYATRSHEILHNMIEHLGFSKFAAKKTESLANEVVGNIGSAKIKDLFAKFKDSEKTFIYDHSYLTLMFSVNLTKSMDWENEVIRQKLATAALFHDLGYKNPENALKEHLPKSKLTELPKSDQEDIVNHSQVMSELLSEIKDMSGDIISLVGKHHEGLGEESYPRGLHATNLSQIDCVFILCHAMTVRLYRGAFNLSKGKEMIDEVCEQYNSGNFKSIIPVFKEMLIKQFGL